MEIKLHTEITIRDICNGYTDNQEAGVLGFSGRLNIRPAFQREFIYDEKKRDAVIDTIRKGFPLNVMYWTETENSNYELLDGQQRTVSFCQYVNGDYSINSRAFHNLTKSEKERILDYHLTIYICNGTDEEKLGWFKTINIASVQLSDQELRNAMYTGPWLTHAKTIFSKSNGAGVKVSENYVSVQVNRQGLLELALKWICARDGLQKVEDYMSAHQHDPNSNELWTHFRNVIEWIKNTFTNTRTKLMKGINWGMLYDRYHDNMYDTNVLETQIKELILDDEVQNKSGVYYYVLAHEEKYLKLRTFSDAQKHKQYEIQSGICPKCKQDGCENVHYEYDKMEGDHKVPWSKGGKTDQDNCRMLCIKHNREIGNH